MSPTCADRVHLALFVDLSNAVIAGKKQTPARHVPLGAIRVSGDHFCCELFLGSIEFENGWFDADPCDFGVFSGSRGAPCEIH